MDKIIPCLWFDGNAEEAANYYVSLFPNASVDKITRNTEAAPGETGGVLTVEFTLNGQSFLGLNGGPQYKFTEAVSFQIPCETQKEIDHYWNGLTDGGKEIACGWVKDRFGLSWQVFPTLLPRLLADPDTAKANRVMKAMMDMVKIDVAAVEKAAAG
jgi:predicted 3-demethylubiquinone-9 3-methyltransferase (glyoxalase superfamily)